MDKKDEQFPETDSDKVVEGAQRGPFMERGVHQDDVSYKGQVPQSQ